MTLNYITLTGTLLPAGAGGSGVFTPSGWLTDSTDELMLPPAPVTAQVTAAGTFAGLLLANDSTGPTPTGWTWTALLTPGAAGPLTFSFKVYAGPFAFTATDASPCVFTATPPSGQPWAPGQTVTMAGASLPGGFASATTYFVVNPSGSTFSLAATKGGAALASTSTGSGNLTVTQVDLSTLAPVQAVTQMAAYLPVSGGTMTGPVILAGSPPLEVPGGSAGKLLTSDASGNITLQAPPGASGTAGGDLSGTYPNPQVAATHLSSPLPVAQGGTGQATQQAAINTLTGTQSAGKVLRSDGTNATLSAIQASDLPAATGSAQGAAVLAGDLGGTATSPQVTGTHLASPLPLAQGGTGQNAASNAALLSALGAAPLASPAFTGTPTAPTAAPLTSNTQVATTAYADASSTAATAYYLRVFAV